jgi:hypothetical protein
MDRCKETTPGGLVCHREVDHEVLGLGHIWGTKPAPDSRDETHDGEGWATWPVAS